MSARRRSRALAFAAVVVFVAVWPLCHRALVIRHQIDPWKLGGFAMYTTYQTSLAALFEATPRGLKLVDERELDGRTRSALQRFRAERSAMGTFRTPDALAAVVHEARPELERLVVVVQRLWLDPETGRIASEKTNFPYHRGQPLR